MCMVQLKVRRPGRHTKQAQAAAALLCEISNTTSLQMPAAAKTSIEITTKSKVSKLTVQLCLSLHVQYCIIQQLTVHHLLDPLRSWASSRLRVSVCTL